MNQVNKTAAQLLMHNLAINLTNRTFMESHDSLIAHRKLYDSVRMNHNNNNNNFAFPIENSFPANSVPITNTNTKNFSDPFFLLENCENE